MINTTLNNFTTVSIIFFNPQNKETELNVLALTFSKYMWLAYLSLDYRIGITLMYDLHLIVFLFD